MLTLCEVVTATIDGDRERPEQRVSLLLRMDPRRFDAALVPSIHWLLRAVPRVDEDIDLTLDLTLAHSVARLRALAELLARCHVGVTESSPLLDAAAQSVLKAIADQAETLRRMLLEAGIAPEPRDLLVEGADPDAPFLAECADA